MSETVSVISPEYAEKVCSHCGQRALCFNAQAFTEPFRPIITACKPCIVARAGGEENIFVKTTWKRLRETWQRNRRGPVPAALQPAVENRQKARQKTPHSSPTT